MEEQKYSFNGQFEGNILIVGRKGCRKTTFIQNLGKNKLFGKNIKEIFWVSKIILSKEREEFIRDSFEDQEVQFSYPHDLDDFNYLTENVMQNRSEDVENYMGELPVVNKLIVMDDLVWLINLKNFQIF